MAVAYEWDVERVETYEDGENDIHDHFHQSTYADCVKQAKEPLDLGEHWDIVLVCDDDSGRSWAYLANGALPEYFEDAGGSKTRKVPQRFHDEVSRIG